MSWLVVLSTFLAAAVEWVEAFTIVLAVGMFKGWKSAWTGAAAAAVILLAVVAAFRSTVGSFPIGTAQTVVGVCLLLFGLRWLHKAILRSAGLKALHDEAESFEETRARLGPGGGATAALDWGGVATAFNGCVLEGLEVIFIVIALGGLKSVGAASIGAVAALAAVLVVGVALRAPLTKVPENTMKYVVGLMLSAFGTFFAGEGVGVAWWHDDVSILVLIGGYAVVSLALVRRLQSPPRLQTGGALRVPKAIVEEIWGLFVGEGILAILTIAVVLAIAVFTERLGHDDLAAWLLALGVVAAVAVALADSLRQTAAKRSGPEAPAAGPVRHDEPAVAEPTA
jgi:uncharacterized membrane protein